MGGPSLMWLGSVSSCVALDKSLWLSDFTFVIRQMGIINPACTTSVKSNPKTMIYSVLLYPRYQRTQLCTQQAWSCLGDLMIVIALSVGICTTRYLTPFRPFPKWCSLEVFPDYALQNCSHLPPCPFYPRNLLFSIVLPTTLILFI